MICDMCGTESIDGRLHTTDCPVIRTYQAQVSQNIESVLAERGANYGDFNEHARITQELKLVMRLSPNWIAGNLTSSMQEALEMTAHKIGRILNGDPKYLDSWVDIEGYIHLVTKELSQSSSSK